MDDNEINIFALNLMIQQFGKIKVISALNGKEALQTVKEQLECGSSFKLIFMDINMPVMGGFECTYKIIKLCEKMNLP